MAPVFASDGVKLNLQNGATISSPVHLEFTVAGLSIKPAGENLSRPDQGLLEESFEVANMNHSR